MPATELGREIVTLTEARHFIILDLQCLLQALVLLLQFVLLLPQVLHLILQGLDPGVGSVRAFRHLR